MAIAENVRKLVACMLTFACTGASASTGSNPFFMFSAARAGSDVIQVINQYATSADYLERGVVGRDANLGSKIGRSHIYALIPTTQQISRACSEGAGLALYDAEHWEATPVQEQNDLKSAISQGKTLAVSAGCAYGIAPDGQYIGLIPGKCDADPSTGIHKQIDWQGIALFNIQAQRLLSDRCGPDGMGKYIAFVTGVVREVRANNPSTKVSAQFSLRYSQPAQIIDAIRQLRGIVDGFYLAYPSQGGHCKYCSAGNVAKVLAAIKAPQ